VQATGELAVQGLIDGPVAGERGHLRKTAPSHLDVIMGFALGLRAGMAGMGKAVITNPHARTRKARIERHAHAIGARRGFVNRFDHLLVRVQEGLHSHIEMAPAFNYRPKFVDIRVKKPASKQRAQMQEPGMCAHTGCERIGECRAPKSRDRMGEFWLFCPEHASEYNNRWNYFQGMDEAELAAFEQSEWVGHRPTWAFRAGRGAREAAAFQAGKVRDRFGVLHGGKAGPDFEPRRPRIGRVQKLAFEVLGLEDSADKSAVRIRYAELVKRYHPDSNGGDRTAEAHLHKVIRAYQVLKAAGFV
jgi:hypothetical protein